MAGGSLPGVVRSTVDGFVTGLVDALPALLAAAIFIPLAYVGIKLLTGVLRFSLERVYPSQHQLVVDLYVAVLRVVLWFGALLALFKIVGFGDIAASLGTASGFLALGIAYALSDMIEDTVSGVYLLRDPDFEVGDRVEVGDSEGEVVAIGLRKSRLVTASGDTLVIRNRDVEGGWTKLASE
ncbi:MAG: mechanosensitive ion channel domain-containing protein [Haloarculaceae archaeon]